MLTLTTYNPKDSKEMKDTNNELTAPVVVAVMGAMKELCANRSQVVRTAELDGQAAQLQNQINRFLFDNGPELVNAWLTLHTQIAPLCVSVARLASIGARIMADQQADKQTPAQ